MVLFSQLVCSTCRKILTFPLGAISCRCRNCQTVNATVHMELICSCCQTTLLMPPNTLSVLCPCCTTVTDVPLDLLPPIFEPVSLENDDEKSAKTIYVEVPKTQSAARAGQSATTRSSAQQQAQVLVATKIL